MATSSYLTVARTKIEYREGGYWVITSDEVPGMLMAGKDPRSLYADIPNVIKMLYKLNYQLDVQVSEVVARPRFIKRSDAQPTHQLKSPKSWALSRMEAA